MLHVINAQNKHHYETVLETMWRQRHDIFIKRLGWDLKTDGIREIDAYDTEDAVYLASINREGQLKGALRLIKTTSSHLMSDHFSHLCADGVPVGETVWEMTRLYSMTGRFRNLVTDKTTSEILVGSLEYAMQEGITSFTCVASMSIFPMVLKAGWELKPLGLPHIMGDELVIAYEIFVNETSLAQLRQSRGVNTPVLFEIGADEQLSAA